MVILISVVSAQRTVWKIPYKTKGLLSRLTDKLTYQLEKF